MFPRLLAMISRVPDDANAAVVSAQVDPNRPSSLHLDLDLVGDLIELILRETEQK